MGDELGVSLVDNGKKFKIDSKWDGQLEMVEAEMPMACFMIRFSS